MNSASETITKFRDKTAFLGFENLNWLKDLFSEQVLPVLDDFDDVYEDPIKMVGVAKNYYAEVDIITISDSEWLLVLSYGEEKLKGLEDQYKLQIRAYELKEQFCLTLDSAELRLRKYPLTTIANSLQRVFGFSQ